MGKSHVLSRARTDVTHSFAIEYVCVSVCVRASKLPQSPPGWSLRLNSIMANLKCVPRASILDPCLPMQDQTLFELAERLARSLAPLRPLHTHTHTPPSADVYICIAGILYVSLPLYMPPPPPLCIFFFFVVCICDGVRCSGADNGKNHSQWAIF